MSTTKRIRFEAGVRPCGFLSNVIPIEAGIRVDITKCRKEVKSDAKTSTTSTTFKYRFGL